MLRSRHPLRLVLIVLVLGPWAAVVSRAAHFDLSTATIADINAAFDAGALTSEKLVSLYLARIAAYDQQGPSLNTIITLNAKALDTARALDAERRAKGPRSPLHGIPILPKDVYDTADMPTSGGFKLMATSQPSRDSFVIARLRAAGAIILGKLNQSDWYGVGKNGGGTLKGRVLSPYNQQKSVGGSSSGTGAAMAAWFATVGLGSDTEGSIVVPSTLNNLVGFSTTHGLVSRTGMMWSSPAQESGGPMGRSLYDCAAVLSVIAGYDAADLPTQDSVGKIPYRPYTAFIAQDGLKGARIGVLREMFHTGALHAEGLALMERAIADMKAAGAVVVDPVLTGLDLFKLLPDADTADYERATAIDKYLAGLPADAPIRSVDEMIAKGGDLVKPDIIATAKLRGTLDHNPGLASVYKTEALMRDAVRTVMEKLRLDVLVLPYRTALPDDITKPLPGNWKNFEVRNHIASSTGFPTMIVPGGFFPSDGMPFGVQFLGLPFTEPTMIKVASGYEAATHHRKPAPLTPALPGESFDY
jgi:Asp-tRNA(Asn)/Glu-tRNA(Gln) amidotransferase A subunit family amidase